MINEGVVLIILDPGSIAGKAYPKGCRVYSVAQVPSKWQATVESLLR